MADGDHRQAQKVELEDIQAQADMPLEELLQMYYGGAADRSGAEEEPSGKQSSHRKKRRKKGRGKFVMDSVFVLN